MSQETVTQGCLGKMSLDSDRLVDTLVSVNRFPSLFQFNPLEAVESENEVQVGFVKLSDVISLLSIPECGGFYSHFIVPFAITHR